MAKFVLGLLMGLIIGMLFSNYVSTSELNNLTAKARTELGKHMPINN